MTDYSYIFNAHPKVIDKMYNDYIADPDKVDEGWRLFFQGFDFNSPNGTSETVDTIMGDTQVSKEFSVLSIIHGFRQRGHLIAQTNPIRPRKDREAMLELRNYGLSDSDLDERFKAGGEIGMPNATLREIVDRLFLVYANDIGIEYVHIENNERRKWLRDKIESRSYEPDYGISLDKKNRILEKLNDAVIFERFLHTKYIGQKRFSLEGGESTIAALDGIITEGAEFGVEEVVIGMAHRGRLNVLANIMQKTYEHIFNEFEGVAEADLRYGSGDVKYHLGYSSQIKTPKGKDVHLKLIPNPSHLEAVDPVVQGFSRAKADILYDNQYDRILPILIHGDAAIAGQGVVYETVQMSKLPGYYTGGTIHFVINNQIGFTTDFDEARSSTYSTGAAMMINAPVFHVNGDDPEAVLFAVELAVEYRQKFNNDVFIDMVCYRKHGHNEGDDPSFTQPILYDIIKNHPNPREVYLKTLVERGDIDQSKADKLEEDFWNKLQGKLDMVKERPLPYIYQEPEVAWRQLKKTVDPEDFKLSPLTGVDQDTIEHILKELKKIPKDFKPHSKVKRLQKSKDKLIAEQEIDWALGELLAYGTILMEQKNVRMSGQDVVRGTFSHRHALYYDVNTNAEYNRLGHLSKDQGEFMIYNSLLSEFAVLGFEYGYSLASPDALVLWEAQFGDFYNGAQTIVDQFITAGESKWQRMSGLVLLLPHGYEGQGPEHSSARVERFLAASAEYNITVANITTPANFFHALRRQIERPFRKPLIVMSPKSLLRHPRVVSKFSELTGKTRFQEFIPDDVVKATKAKRLLLCTGKIYYDLLEKREELGIDDVAIARVEQLYPLPEDAIRKEIKKHKKAEVFWVQEEPENMGYWYYLLRYFRKDPIEVITRPASASPATGYKQVHVKEQELILTKALT